MGWENPPVSWRELERRLSWNVTRLPPGPERNQKPRRRAGPEGENPAEPPGAEQPWAELHCHSSYSFLDGASSPGELVAEAARLGLRALAVTDHDGMYGVAQFAQAAARIRTEYQTDLATVFGAELSLNGARNGPERNGPQQKSPQKSPERAGSPDPGGQHLLVLARDAEGYKRLSAVISAAQLAGGGKGRPVYELDALTARFGPGNVFTELTFHDQPGDDERNGLLAGLAHAAGVGVVATGNV